MYGLSQAQDDAPPLPQTTAAPDVCVNPANQRIVDYLGLIIWFLLCDQIILIFRK